MDRVLLPVLKMKRTLSAHRITLPIRPN